MQKFGVTVEWHREGDELVFNIPGKQKYSPTEMTFEGDWSAAVNFIVAAAIFGSLTIKGLNLGTIQADKKILDVVRGCGASVEELPDGGGIRVSRGSLRAFDFDATDSPDLVPALSVPEWPACATRRATVPWSWRRASMPWAFRPGSTETLWTSPV